MLRLSFLFSIILWLNYTPTLAQYSDYNGKWRAEIFRADGVKLPFEVNVNETLSDVPSIEIKNGSEVLHLKHLQILGDSIRAEMPVFESGFVLAIGGQDTINGYWYRQLANNGVQKLPVSIFREKTNTVLSKVDHQVAGDWLSDLSDCKQKESVILTLRQERDSVFGSLLTTTGDYRYLSGVLRQDSLHLSTFDGVHALRIDCRIDKSDSIVGMMWSGAAYSASIRGVKKLHPELENTTQMYLKDSSNPYLNFAFQDLDGNKVSIQDDRFKGNVVIIDIMGSWCPNCMDETAFLSNYYNSLQEKNVEIIGLAYELTTNMEKSKASLEKFRKQFNIKYPILLTGVSVTDTLRTEKTIPQLTKIKMFPSTIFLDKTGKVATIETGFNGPATGEYFKEFVRKFDKTVKELLAK